MILIGVWIQIYSPYYLQRYHLLFPIWLYHPWSEVELNSISLFNHQDLIQPFNSDNNQFLIQLFW